jgi:hypothetical protein
MLQSKAITKAGRFDVNFNIIPNSVVGFKVNAIMIIKSQEFAIENINLNFDDRIDITPAIAEQFGVAYNSNIKLKCNLDNVIKEVNRMKEEAKDKKYDGKMIESGYGFQMSNTYKNHLACIQYGYDAIEKIK